MENSFDPKGSYITLKPDIFPIASDYAYGNNEVQSTFLHEYIHYIQDSTTFYGVKYKLELINNSVNVNVRGIMSDEGYFKFDWQSFDPYTFDVKNDRFWLNEEILGSISIKENMATMAQNVVYDTVLPNRPVFYYQINEFIKQKVCDDSFSCFIIEDCSLMSEDPSKSIILLCNKLQNVKAITNQKECHELYDKCYKILEDNNLLKDIASIQVDEETFNKNLRCHIGGLLFGSKGPLNEKDSEIMIDVCASIKNSFDNNMQNRVKNKYLVGDALLELKTKKNIAQLIEIFGTPFIIENGKKSNNKDMLINNNN